MHLLHQEAEPLAHRLAARVRQELAEQLHVRAQADGLLADVPPLGQVRNLSRQPLLVHLDVLRELRDHAPQTVPLRDQPRRRPLDDALQRRADRFDPRLEVGAQAQALFLAHGQARARGSFRHRLERIHRELRRLGVLRHDEVAVPGEQRDVHLARQL